MSAQVTQINNGTNSVVSKEWFKRGPDERYTSLTALAAQRRYQREHSKQLVTTNRSLTVVPSTTDLFDIALTRTENGKTGIPVNFTHWSFSQLSALASVPAGYMRSGIPGPLVADCMNWGLQQARSVDEIGILLRRDPDTNQASIAAATGPNYGRIWDFDVTDELVHQFGDGVSGDWRVPGEFGKRVNITKENTTIYGSDRDMWIFLADETNRVEIPNRRNGQSGSFARGFYISNSEVGFKKYTLGAFLFDYACGNRILWGVQEQVEISFKHTKGAPDKWKEEVKPILAQLARTDISAKPFEETLKAAQAAKIKGDVEEFLSKRFGKINTSALLTQHMVEEDHPIETIFDAVTAATAYAKSLTHQDARTELEREAGKLLIPFSPSKQRELVRIN
jgi:hypothetical protein